MSKLLERLLRERAERERRAKEREERKKANAKAIAERDKKKRSERLRKKRQNRQNWNRRRRELEARRKAGDVKGYYMVIITKDRKKIKNLGHSFWSLKSYERYNEAISENRESVKFPLKYTTMSDKRQKAGDKPKKVNYEILLVSKVADGEDNIASFRDDNGKLVDHYFVDRSDYLILKRDEWLVEEKFTVYGYNPTRERKTYSFILDTIKSDVSPDNTKRVMRYNNKLVVVKDDNDIGFVSCKTSEQCEELYDKLTDDVNDPNVFFQGKVGPELVTWVMNLIEEKTGWTRRAIKRHFIL